MKMKPKSMVVVNPLFTKSSPLVQKMTSSKHSATMPTFYMPISQPQERQKCNAIMSLQITW